MTINCEFREQSGNIPLCRVVSDVTELPLDVCHVNDSACQFCLNCGIAPQTPNSVVTSMSVAAYVRAGQTPPRHMVAGLQREVGVRPNVDNTPCVFRNQKTREVECKPCQSGGRPPLLPVYRCNSGKHTECTLMNTGIVPKIQGCITCPDRLETYPVLPLTTTPQSVLLAMSAKPI